MQKIKFWCQWGKTTNLGLGIKGAIIIIIYFLYFALNYIINFKETFLLVILFNI